MASSFRTQAESLLQKAGVTINGDKPYDIKVHNEKFYQRVLAEGSLGLGESYMDKWWDVDQLDEFFNKVLQAQLEKEVRLDTIWHAIKARVLNLQSSEKAFEVAEHHYDLGNDLYKAMLDRRLVYTCGYWKDADNLDDAQEAKLDLICKKLYLKEGMTILDIGCGWGSFAQFAAEKYGAKVTGITLSKEQAELAKERTKDLPVTIRVEDYRDTKEKFDRVVSIGMFEHVGYKNYATYMDAVHRTLKDGGLSMLHTIGGLKSVKSVEAWIEKYIFPNSMLPSIQQIGRACEKRFVVEDLHNFGADYDTTLMAWFENFDRNWPTIKDQYDERFYRMWKYYLLACAGSFRARKNQLWQIVLSKDGVPGGYTSVR